ncbi:MAG: zinc dependent phospholipase C family protein [Treponema sp.]|jgi:hypothetical protein|nr:zinc dependent phospholipase C family protein [Treponema sp.]
MPSQILHTLFGEDLIDGIYRRLVPRFGILADKALEKIRGDYRRAFVLGCQGPDIFYHSQRSRPVALEYGSLLHRRGCGVFAAELLRMSLPEPPPSEDDIRSHRHERAMRAAGVYALGFMTHAVLDRFCHPFIVYKTYGLNRIFHPFFERIIDVLMLKELRGKDAASWDQETLLAGICEEPPPGLKELIARALIAVFPERAGKDRELGRRMDNAFIDAAHFYRLSAPARTSLGAGCAGETLFLIRPEFLAYTFPERLPGDVDFLNLKHGTWYYPRQAGPPEALSGGVPPRPGPDRRSFPEIYSAALAAAEDSLAPAIIRYLDTGIFPIVEAARSIGNGSLSIQDDGGKPCAPNFGEALPLEKVLRQQAELRNIPLEL